MISGFSGDVPVDLLRKTGFAPSSSCARKLLTGKGPRSRRSAAAAESLVAFEKRNGFIPAWTTTRVANSARHGAIKSHLGLLMSYRLWGAARQLANRSDVEKTSLREFNGGIRFDILLPIAAVIGDGGGALLAALLAAARMVGVGEFEIRWARRFRL